MIFFLADGNVTAKAETGMDRVVLQQYSKRKMTRVRVVQMDGDEPTRIVFAALSHKSDPPLDDLRDVLDWMHVEIASSSQCDIIEPRDRDKLLALAGRVEAWLVEQGEAR